MKGGEGRRLEGIDALKLKLMLNVANICVVQCSGVRSAYKCV